MLLLREGQRPLLEYLRNLTPQILLSSTALVLGVHLDFYRFDPTNWVTTFAFFFCVALVGLAFFANMNIFLDALLDTLSPYGRVARRLRLRGIRPGAAALGSLRVMSRQRPTLLLDLIFSMAIVNIGLLAVTFGALNAARALLK